MVNYQCTCHCGGDMFYRHMHAESCLLSIHGDPAPETEVDRLERQVADLTAQVEAQNAEIRDMRKSIDTAAQGIVRLTTERDDLTAQLKAKDAALEFAKAAIGDAIYLEEGLDGETGQRVQRLIVQALERGTFDVPGELGDFLAKRERVAQDQIADLTAKLAAGRQWTNEQPRTPGWYWWKGRPDVCPDVHYVSEQDIAEGNPPGLWCGPLEAPR